MEKAQTKPRTPFWLWLVGALGLAWNAFGAFQFFKGLGNTRDSLMAGGMTEAAAVAYLGLPWWMTLAFGIGTLGGLLGCVLLVMRKALALPVFAASMLAYIILFLGDWAYGIFSLVEGQFAVLLVVELIAAALLALAWRMNATGQLNA